MGRSVQRTDLISKVELDEQCSTKLTAVAAAMRGGGATNISGQAWGTTRELLQEISASRAHQGFSRVEVATFVLSLKQPLFSAIRRDLAAGQDSLFETVWAATELLDRLALITTEASMTAREELISRQQQELASGRLVVEAAKERR